MKWSGRDDLTWEPIVNLVDCIDKSYQFDLTSFDTLSFDLILFDLF